MKFIIDAQLPYRLKNFLIENGYDAIHTVDLPNKNLTSDVEIIQFAEKENRIVITKDGDFFKYFLIHKIPKRILMITTGNIKNKKLLDLILANFENIINYYINKKKIIELDNNSITVHY